METKDPKDLVTNSLDSVGCMLRELKNFENLLRFTLERQVTLPRNHSVLFTKYCEKPVIYMVIMTLGTLYPLCR